MFETALPNLTLLRLAKHGDHDQKTHGNKDGVSGGGPSAVLVGEPSTEDGKTEYKAKLHLKNGGTKTGYGRVRDEIADFYATGDNGWVGGIQLIRNQQTKEWGIWRFETAPEHSQQGVQTAHCQGAGTLHVLGITE